MRLGLLLKNRQLLSGLVHFALPSQAGFSPVSYVLCPMFSALSFLGVFHARISFEVGWQKG
jgi:hypothetical protein